ncbi:MAG TPA: hypothetical protein VI997_00750 [Candidatus Thermoplasmatota archaeon]|nr:hypothetical protein [Candidatus Thermoplasmatota archaeon]
MTSMASSICGILDKLLGRDACDPPPTTQSCAETGCGDPWPELQ